MLKIKVESKIEQALKAWKNKVKRTKQNFELRNRKEYTKPSVKRREELNKAKYIQKIKDNEDFEY
jgi:small subunit ribosomal protein S21